jgi:hypothetical protein
MMEKPPNGLMYIFALASVLLFGILISGIAYAAWFLFMGGAR